MARPAVSQCKGLPEECWWELWPTRLEDELHAFERHGIEVKVRLKKKGFLIIEGDWTIAGRKPVRLEIGFSPFHPFFRPAVAAPEEQLERHQHPISKVLCLLTQESGQWDWRQLVADFIDERLQQLLAAIAARKEKQWEEAAALEEQAADPLMPYFAGASENDSVILFEGSMALPPAHHGLMDLKFWNRATQWHGRGFEAVLHQLKTGTGRLLGNTFSVPEKPPGEQTVVGRWVRLKPPPTGDAEALLAAAEEELKNQALLQPHSVKAVNEAVAGPPFVTGIVFPEEVEYGPARGGVGWLFLVTRPDVENGLVGSGRTTLVRSERASEQDVFARLPIASALRKKKALVIGCGAIGSFVAVELARAGVGTLGLLDSDIVEPGNSLRWPLGRPLWGISKTTALAGFVRMHYPWTKTIDYQYRIGEAATDAGRLQSHLTDRPGPLSQLLEAIGEADVVVDTSASTELQHAVAYYCKRLRKHYVMGYGTIGLGGGIVARFPPDCASCWVCMHEHWNDKTIPRLREVADGIVTPVGCNESTFTGGGFDLQEISLEVVRSAVGWLTDGVYEPGAWLISMLELRDDEGHRVLPTWESYDCPPHPRCCGRGG